MKPLIFTLLRYTSAEQGFRKPTLRFYTAGASSETTVGTCVAVAT
jgi:hypothetical protein